MSTNESTRKRPTKRTTAPEWTERDQEWAAASKVWMEDQAAEFFEKATKRADYYTASDVLGWLDTRLDLPTCYVRFLSDYNTRYNWANGLLERWARSGELEVGSTVNARGRESRCYRKPRAQEYDIQVEGPHADRIRTAIMQWLANNPDLGLDSLLITRGKDEPAPKAEFAADGSQPPPVDSEANTQRIQRRARSKTSLLVEQLRQVTGN